MIATRPASQWYQLRIRTAKDGSRRFIWADDPHKGYKTRGEAYEARGFPAPQQFDSETATP